MRKIFKCYIKCWLSFLSLKKKTYTRWKKPYGLEDPNGAKRDTQRFYGKDKKGLNCYGQRFFQLFTYNTQRFSELLIDQYLFLFVYLFKTTLQMTNHRKVKTYHPWVKPSIQPRHLWVWRVARPIIPALSQVLNLDACWFDELPNSSFFSLAKCWAHMPLMNQRYFYYDRTVNKKYCIMMGS